MKFSGFKIGLIMVLLIFLVIPIQSNAQTYGLYSKAKYVKSTPRDSMTLPGFSGEKKTGIITNESASIALEIFFAKLSSSVAIDSNTYFKIPAGKTLLFQTGSVKLYRRAISDSVFSQVYLGNVNLGYIELPDNQIDNPGFGLADFHLIDNREYEKIKEAFDRHRSLSYK